MIDQPYWIMSGIYLTVLLGILAPSVAEWPFVPVFFTALAPTFIKSTDNPRWSRFAAIAAGSLSAQILFWIA